MCTSDEPVTCGGTPSPSDDDVIVDIQPTGNAGFIRLPKHRARLVFATPPRMHHLYFIGLVACITQRHSYARENGVHEKYLRTGAKVCDGAMALLRRIARFSQTAPADQEFLATDTLRGAWQKRLNPTRKTPARYYWVRVETRNGKEREIRPDKDGEYALPVRTRKAIARLFNYREVDKMGVFAFAEGMRIRIEPEKLFQKAVDAYLVALRKDHPEALTTTPDPSIVRKHCTKLITTAEKTWCQLPLSDKFREAEPIPLSVTWSVYEGPRPVEEYPSSSPTEAVDAATSKGGVMVLCGCPGGGKSVAMQWLAREHAQKWFKDPEKALPVYVDLGGFKHAASVAKLRAAALRAELRNAPRIFWFMDGLDLLPETGRLSAHKLLRDARRRTEESNRTEIFLFSVRDSHPAMGVLDGWPISVRLQLAPLSDEDRDEWVQQYAPDALPELEDFTVRHSHCLDFLDNPLLFACVLSSIVDSRASRKPFSCDTYPGRAGLLHAFSHYAVNRAIVKRRLTQTQSKTLDWNTVEGVFWAALRARQEDRFLDREVPDYCRHAFTDHAESRLRKWKRATHMLHKAGLLQRMPDNDGYRVLHQQFAEHWAGKHLASCLKDAKAHGYLDAELWDHLQEVRLDEVTAQAFAVLSRKGETEGPHIVEEAFAQLSSVDPKDAYLLMGDVRGTLFDEDRRVLAQAVSRQAGWDPDAIPSFLGALAKKEGPPPPRSSPPSLRDKVWRNAGKGLEQLSGEQIAKALIILTSGDAGRICQCVSDLMPGRIAADETDKAQIHDYESTDLPVLAELLILFSGYTGLQLRNCTDAIPFLSRLLRENEDPEKRERAVLALELIGGPDTLCALRGVLRHSKLDMPTQLQVITAIERISSGEAIQYFRRHVGIQDGQVVAALSSAVRNAYNAEEAIEVLATLLEDDLAVRHRLIASYQSGRSIRDDARLLLIQGLKRASLWDVCVYGLTELGRAGTQRYCQQLSTEACQQGVGFRQVYKVVRRLGWRIVDWSQDASINAQRERQARHGDCGSRAEFRDTGHDR